MLGLMRLGSCCCKCAPPTSVKRIAGLIDLSALLVIPLIFTLAGNKIPMGPLNKLVKPLGVGAKYGLFFIVTPVGGVAIFCIYKSWKPNEDNSISAIDEYERQSVKWTHLIDHERFNKYDVSKETINAVIRVINGKEFKIGQDGNYVFYFYYSNFPDLSQEETLSALEVLKTEGLLTYNDDIMSNGIILQIIIEPQHMDHRVLGQIINRLF